MSYSIATEKDAKEFITIGMSESQIRDKFGQPNRALPGADGSEMWQYLVNPHLARANHSHYYGFEITFINEKVANVTIILGSDSSK